MVFHKATFSKPDGSVGGLIGAVLDITERKRAEEDLRASEERYRLIFDYAPLGILHFDQTGTVRNLNEKFAEIIGASKEKTLGFNMLEGVRDPAFLQAVKDAIDGGFGYYEGDYLSVLGGKTTPLSAIYKRISGEDGKFSGAVGIFEDITERKRAEKELRDSEQQLRSIIHGYPLPAFVIGKDHQVLYWNKALEEMSKIKADEVAGTDLHWRAFYGKARPCMADLLVDEAPIEVISHWYNGIPNKSSLLEDVYEATEFFPELGGEGKWLHCVAAAIRNSIGTLVGAIETLEDISDRKKAEEVLRESENRYRAIFENTGAATFIVEEDTIISLVNAEFEKLTGYTRDEIENKRRWTELVVKEDLERMLYQHRLRRADAKAALKQYEFRIIDKHDQIRDCLLTVDMIAGTKRSIASFLDITERRQTEQKAAQLAAIVESSDDAIIGKNLDGSITSWNRGAEKIYGYAASEVIGKPISILFASGLEDDAKQILEKIKSGEPVEHYETVRRRKDGRDIHMSLTVSSIRNYKGIIVAASTIGRDITDRKQAEDALQQSEEQFRTLVESAPDAIFIEVGGRFVYLNDAAIHMYGAASEEELSGHAIIGRIHPDHRANVLERIRFIDEERKPTPLMELKHVKLDGTTVYAESHAVPIKYRKSKAALVFVRDITERKKNEEALSISEERYRRLFEDASMGIFRVTLEGKLIDVNPAFTLMFGFDSQEEVKSQVNDVAVDLFVDPSRRHEIVRMMLDTKRPVHAESLYRRKDGSTFTADLHAWAVRDKEGKLLYLEGFVEDISERKRAKEEKEKLEAQLFQAQKMESVGRLAGGVAHDFNNMLGVIIGRAEMALQQDVSNDKLKHHLDEILKAALRSADLTKQLLAFARKQTAVPKILSLNDTISGMLQMLRRLIGEDIDLLWGPELDLWKVKIDPSQVDQILANLAVNARDAISGVGAITLRTENVVIDDSNWADTPEFIPGEYVLLTVSDNGSGMSEEVRSNIFEPFFTTKEIGKGTGLGLSTVYGIVKQNDGFIYVESEPGKGTTFKIYLPRFEAETAHVPSGEINVKRLTGTETILLVEDDEAILDLGKMILENLGYTVLAAQTVVDSISLVKEHPGDIHLVITDVVMPEMNGRELAEKLRVIRPNLKCLYMSGYTADVIAHRGILDGGLNFIQKPFRRDDLAAKVRQVLDHLG